MTQRLCSAYLPPEARLYGGIPLNTLLGLCIPLSFLIYHLSYSFIYNSIIKHVFKKLEKIAIF